MTIVKPPRLKRSDVIGIVAPASAPSTEERISKGAAYLERLGYRVELGAHIRSLHGYLAGLDEERASDFNTMVLDKRVKAIFAVRGGYGTPRILQMIDYRALRRNPKIIVGYSDMTGLQLAVFRKIGLVSFSGPMPGVEMWKDIDPFTEEHFWRLITSAKKIGQLENPAETPWQVLKQGKAHGRLLGGNFSLVSSLMGTPFLPPLRNSLLFLEDVEEAPHRIDRMLAQMLNAGILRNLAGLIFGRFTDCTPSNPSDPHLTVQQVQEEYADKLERPVIADLQYGHIPCKLTLPIGVQAALDTKKKKLEVLESGVE